MTETVMDTTRVAMPFGLLEYFLSRHSACHIVHFENGLAEFRNSQELAPCGIRIEPSKRSTTLASTAWRLYHAWEACRRDSFQAAESLAREVTT